MFSKHTVFLFSVGFSFVMLTPVSESSLDECSLSQPPRQVLGLYDPHFAEGRWRLGEIELKWSA